MFALALAADGLFAIHAVQLRRYGINPAFASWLQQSGAFQRAALASGGLVPVPAVWVMTRGVRGRLGRWAAKGLSIGVAIVGLFCGSEMVWTTLFCFHDSDVAMVPRKNIDPRLQMWTGTKLPPSASDIHVVFSGGISPAMLLKFKANEEEARRFVKQILARFEINERAEQCGVPPDWPRDIFDKTWWCPSAKASWWSEPRCFIQRDMDGQVVFLAILLN